MTPAQRAYHNARVAKMKKNVAQHKPVMHRVSPRCYWDGLALAGRGPLEGDDDDTDDDEDELPDLSY